LRQKQELIPVIVAIRLARDAGQEEETLEFIRGFNLQAIPSNGDILILDDVDVVVVGNPSWNLDDGVQNTIHIETRKMYVSDGVLNAFKRDKRWRKVGQGVSHGRVIQVGERCPLCNCIKSPKKQTNKKRD